MTDEEMERIYDESADQDKSVLSGLRAVAAAAFEEGVAETRENDAKVCEAYGVEIGDKFYPTDSKRCAEAIRALAQQPGKGE